MEGNIEKERNKPPRIEVRTTTKYEPKCIGCNKDEQEKVRVVYENKREMYEFQVAFCSIYSFLLTIFQIAKADAFRYFCVKFGKMIGEFYITAWNYISSIEFSSSAGTVLAQSFFLLCIVAVSVCAVVGILFLYIKPEWMCHLGTVAELVVTLGLVINLDRQIWELWHHNLLLIWLYSQIIYFVLAFLIWKKFIDS